MSFVPLATCIIFVALFVVLAFRLGEARERRSAAPGIRLSMPSYPDALPRLHRELNRARRHDRPLSVAVVRLEESEGPKSTPPESVQDHVGEVVRRLLRETDFVALDRPQRRLVLLLPETRQDQALELARRLSTAVHSSCGPRLSIGVASYGLDCLSMDELVLAGSRLCANQSVERSSGSLALGAPTVGKA